MFIRRTIAVAMLVLAPGLARAQAVHGTVVDATDRPVSGVVVLLVDSASHVAGRALTSETGDFRVAAPRAGQYRLRTMRIGFRPVVSDPIAVSSGSDVVQRIVLAGVPLGLDTVRVAGQDVCRAFSDSGAATFRVWEQIRTALTAAELTAGARSIAATTVSYTRSIDPHEGRDGKIFKQQATVSTDYVTRAWRTLKPDSLHRVGYVVTDRDNSVTYYAPGLDMLLSPIFVDDHCFKLVSDSKRPSSVGIAFEPTPDRRHGAAELEGTIWVDRASSELRQLEFRYQNVSPEQREFAGGEIAFARLRDGAWAVARWGIHMPVIDEVVVPGHGAEQRVNEVQVVGGQLALARRGNDTLWTGPRFPLHGVVIDSASGRSIAGAKVAVADAAADAVTDGKGRFEISNLVAGQYTVLVRTASLDSLRTRHSSPVTVLDSSSSVELRVPPAKQLVAAVCGANAPADGGIVLGTLKLGTGSNARTPRGGQVTAEWRTDPKDSTHLRREQAHAASDGAFRFCGVPLNTSVTLRATADSAETPGTVPVTFEVGSRLARVQLALERTADLAALGATFSGVVVNDSSHAPIIGAEVAFPEIGKSVLTNERGEFIVLGIPAGEQHLVVRRIGFGAADANVAFKGHETVARRIVLGKAITLDPVVVSEHATDRTMPGFEENRRVGLGHFLIRADLEKYTGMQLRTVLQQVPGFGYVAGRGHDWPTGSRGNPPMCPSKGAGDCLASHGYYAPTDEELRQGMRTACYSQVYLDGTLMNGDREPTEPFDLTTIPPERVEAIEYYSSAAQTPMKYSRMGSDCGVVVIWTRRE